MTYIIGDSFDYYAAITDAGAGYWDVATSASLTTGRFTGSQAVGVGAMTTGTVVLSKSSASNDQTHHIVVAFEQTVALSGVIAGMTLTLMDGTTAQCSIVFQSSGNILLTSGAGGGTTLATYTSAFSASTWAAFEFEVTIDNTAGVFRARKNGNVVNDFQATNLNTRGGTTNSYANKLQVVYTTNGAPLNGSTTAQLIDDLLWFNTTGATPNTWVGDVRSYVLMPISDVSTSFSPSSNPFVVNTGSVVGTVSRASGTATYQQFTASATGTISTATVEVNTGGTGNLKAAIFSNNGGVPGTVLSTSNVVVNPSAGFIALTFPSPASVTKNTVYWIGFDQDFTIVFTTGSVSNQSLASSTAYASFPANNPATGSNQQAEICAISIGNPTNSSLVSETAEDGSTSYVYSSTVGATDFYNAADLPGTPASIVAVTTRGFGQKSDAGTRIGQIQMKSGSTTVQSGATALATSFTWQSRTDTTDPNTGTTWTASGVNALQIGPTVGG